MRAAFVVGALFLGLAACSSGDDESEPVPAPATGQQQQGLPDDCPGRDAVCAADDPGSPTLTNYQCHPDSYGQRKACSTPTSPKYGRLMCCRPG